MSYLENALKRITATIDRRIAGMMPFRAIVQSTTVDHLVYIKRYGADTADAQPYGKIAAHPLANGDDVLCMQVNGTVVVLGKVNAPAITGGGGSGAVGSVNGKTGAVVLDADDINDASTSHKFATAAQLSKLDGINLSNYVLASSLSLVATSGDYDDLTGKPTLFDGNYSSLSGIPGTFAPSPHNHLMSDITDAGDLATQDAVSVSDIDASGTPGTTTYLRGDGTWTGVPAAGNPDWDDITGKPTAFPPEPHNHDERYYTQTEVEALLQGQVQLGFLYGSPNNLNTTVVSPTYADMTPLGGGTLTSIIPEITTGTWEVSIMAYATVHRSVATGGVYLGVGVGVSSSVALNRNSDQSKAKTINRAVVLKTVAPSDVIELRFSGFSTPGDTYCNSYGATITAIRRA